MVDFLLFFPLKSKRIINVGTSLPNTSHVIITSPNLAHEARVRVSCGHCNEIFIVSKKTSFLYSKLSFIRNNATVGL